MTAQPNSDIYLLSGVPIDNTYENTIWFSGIEAQALLMADYAKYKLTSQSYQRVSAGIVRVGKTADELYDINYMMFRNAAYGDKWFYAFVTEIEYKNESMSLVHFEVDVIQSWFFEAKIGRCYVEREHSATDALFSNTVPENLELGDEYVLNPSISGESDTFFWDSTYVLLASESSSGGKMQDGAVINGVFTPLLCTQYQSAEALNTELKGYISAGREDSIIAIYQVPAMVKVRIPDGTITYKYNPVASQENITIKENLTSIDGYIPRNKKLLSYPFNFISVSNCSGQTAIIKWELWDLPENRGKFNISGVAVSTPAMMCAPSGYRGADVDRESGLTLTNFPQCAWVGDTFKAWWAQNRSSAITSGITTAITAIAGAAGGNPSAIGSGVASIAGDLARVQDIKRTPSQAHGQTQTDSLNAGLGRVGFVFEKLSIRKEYARIIDDYFDKFGYATHRIKVPNRNVRKEWTYVKTRGCFFTGSIPQEDAKKIRQVYDGGITFWRTPSHVGNYGLDNSPG